MSEIPPLPLNSAFTYDQSDLSTLLRRKYCRKLRSVLEDWSEITDESGRQLQAIWNSVENEGNILAVLWPSYV